jgi:hypothetical protein
MRVAVRRRQHPPSGCGTERHLSVANGFKSVHPSFHPISHSTHVGFKLPPICSLKGREFLSCVAWLALPLRQSRAVGVAKVRALTASISVPPSRLLRGVTRPPLVPRLAVGVGQFACTAIARLLTPKPALIPRSSSFCEFSAVNPACFAMPQVGVGHKPEAVALVRGSNIGSSQHCPAAVIPERGQVTKDSSESPSKQGWAVFHEHETGSNFAHDPRHVSPHPAALAVNAGPLAGNADVLAREASRNHVNNSAPRVSVKGPNVIPNRAGREKAVILSGGKNARGVWLPLDSADRVPSELVASEYSSTSAREKSQLIHAYFRSSINHTHNRALERTRHCVPGRSATSLGLQSLAGSINHAAYIVQRGNECIALRNQTGQRFAHAVAVLVAQAVPGIVQQLFQFSHALGQPEAGMPTSAVAGWDVAAHKAIPRKCVCQPLDAVFVRKDKRHRFSRVHKRSVKC